MKDERQGINKEQMIKDAKENSDLVEFIKSLTKEEMLRIKQIREFSDIKPNTITYNIAVLCDQLRQNVRRLKLDIGKRLWNIDDLTNAITRLNTQLLSGVIVETMKNGVVMNENELKSLIKQHEWLRDGEFFALYPRIAELRSNVGHVDVSKRVIMELDAFDKYVEEIAEYVKKYGYDLFGELT